MSLHSFYTRYLVTDLTFHFVSFNVLYYTHPQILSSSSSLRFCPFLSLSLCPSSLSLSLGKLYPFKVPFYSSRRSLTAVQNFINPSPEPPFDSVFIEEVFLYTCLDNGWVTKRLNVS